jgi:signal transduction histidine kinase
MTSYDDLILNVDDTEAARYAKTRILQRAGFQVIEAGSGAEALALAAARRPALVLLDTKLPDISGFDVCARLKQNPHTAMVLVLQTSASYLAKPDKVRALDIGADNYLFEPIEPEELVANVRALLRLARAEQALRDMNRRKDEFLAILAHELRNPLGPIRNAVELLRKLAPGAPPEQENARQMIIRQTDHMVRLVDDLLDVSRISQGKITLRLAPVEMGELARATLETARAALERRSHTVTAVLPAAPLWVAGDGVRLAQILGNLLNNAGKFTPPGGKIGLLVAHHDASGADAARALVQVSDNGIGIAGDQIETIFHMFAQAGHAPDRVQDGLGIGLSLVRTLIGLHGGEVRASSPGPGLGSTFEVLLPLAEAPLAPAAQAPQGPAATVRQVLVVDDSVDAAEMVASLLEFSGHRVSTAHSGAEAIAQAKAAPPDIVFLDIGLPDMSGMQAARAMRRLPELDGTRLVALSGYGQESDRENALAAGFDDHLTKPATLEALSAAIGELD